MLLRLDPTDPKNMSSAERCEEIASIFARGVLRLHGRVTGDNFDSEVLEDSLPTCLELSATLRPDRTTG